MPSKANNAGYTKQCWPAAAASNTRLASWSRPRGGLEELEAAEPLARRKRDEADHCLDRLQRSATNRYIKTVVRWNSGRLLAAGALAGITGCAAFFGITALIDGTDAWLAALPGGLLAALLFGGPLLWYSRSVSEVADDSARRGLLSGIKDDWRLRIGEDFPVVESLEAASEALTRFRLEYESLQKQIDSENDRVRSLKTELHAIQSEREAAVDRERAQNLEIAAWFRQRQVEDRAGYVLKRDELRRRLEDRNRLEAEVAGPGPAGRRPGSRGSATGMRTPAESSRRRRRARCG